MFFQRQLKQPGAVIAMGMAGFLGACGGGGGSSAVPEVTNRAKFESLYFMSYKLRPRKTLRLSSNEPIAHGFSRGVDCCPFDVCEW